MGAGVDLGWDAGQCLADLRGADPEKAAAAFAALWEISERRIDRFARRRGVAVRDLEDILQEVRVRLWSYRGSVRAESLVQWHGFVRRTTERIISRFWTASQPYDRLDDDPEIPDADRPYLNLLAEAAEARGRLYDGADRLWLGEHEEPEIEVAVTAVQMVVTDGLTETEAAAVFGVPPTAVSRWIGDPAVVARALFACLCWSPEVLAGYVLRPQDPLPPSVVESLLAQPAAIGEWTAPEVGIVLRRIVNGMRTSQIESICAGSVSSEVVVATLKRVREALPFGPLAEALRGALERRGHREAMTRPGLWKRLAVEYHASQDLPLKQVLERTAPAATVAPYPLGAKTLDNWLSGGRLYVQLAAYLAEEAYAARP